MEKDFNIFLKKAETEVEEMPTFKEYAIDFKTGEYIKDENNDIKVLEKNEALKVWIFKALKTERFRYVDVHSDNYGSELETNIAAISKLKVPSIFDKGFLRLSRKYNIFKQRWDKIQIFKERIFKSNWNCRNRNRMPFRRKSR